MGCMRVMGSVATISDRLPEGIADKIEVQGGDTTIAWPDQVSKDEAKATFDALVEVGFRGYKMEGKNGEQIDVFDPDAAELLVAAPMAGG